jgi:prephenate dehydrogenase
MRPIGIVGLGLIGGSIGLGLRLVGRRVIGIETDPSNARAASERGCADEITHELNGLAECEVVFLCTNPSAMPKIMSDLVEIAADDAVITDTSSTKAPIAAAIPKELKERFVIGHPMAGHHTGGPSHARADLFKGAVWLICETPDVKPEAITAVSALAAELGARRLDVPLEDHDLHVGILSHLPHVYASLLVLDSGKLRHPEAAGSSWGEMTRVGGAHPALWADILNENRKVLAALVSTARTRLQEVEEALLAGDPKPIERLFEDAKQVREEQE